jgi:hypothetical protein
LWFGFPFFSRGAPVHKFLFGFFRGRGFVVWFPVFYRGGFGFRFLAGGLFLRRFTSFSNRFRIPLTGLHDFFTGFDDVRKSGVETILALI